MLNCFRRFFLAQGNDVSYRASSHVDAFALSRTAFF